MKKKNSRLKITDPLQNNRKYIKPGGAPSTSRLNLFEGYMDRYNKSLAREAVGKYCEVAEKHGLSPTQLALGWCVFFWFSFSFFHHLPLLFFRAFPFSLEREREREEETARARERDDNYLSPPPPPKKKKKKKTGAPAGGRSPRRSSARRRWSSLRKISTRSTSS